MSTPSATGAEQVPGVTDAADAADATAAGAANPPRRGQLRRADKIMTAEEVDGFLAGAFCGRTATVGADGYPYVVPNLFVWARGLVYVHTAKLEGHFLANVRHCDRVSFEIDEAGEIWAYGPVECDTTVSYRSVIVFGRIREIDTPAEKTEFYSRFMRKYAPADSWGREVGSFPRIDKTIVYAITPEAITGKSGPLPPLAERWPQKRPPVATATAVQAASPVQPPEGSA